MLKNILDRIYRIKWISCSAYGGKNSNCLKEYSKYFSRISGIAFRRFLPESDEANKISKILLAQGQNEFDKGSASDLS